MEFSPDELAAWTGGNWSSRPAHALTGFTIDSRRVRPGEVFVALRTDRRDGHDYVFDALARGAAAVIVARPLGEGVPALVVADPEEALRDCARAHRRRFTGPVVGVTGSAGKTSTKDLLQCLLGRDETLATEGNLNNTLGVPLTLLRLDPAAHRAAVIEAGINRPGEMEVLAELIAPTHGIVTMVGLAHAEGLGGVAGIAREKARLLAAVPAQGVVTFPAACLEFPAFRQFAAEVRAVSADLRQAATGCIHFSSRGGDEQRDPRLPRQRDRQTERQRYRQTERHRQISQTMEWSDRADAVLEIGGPALPPIVLAFPPMSEGMRQNLVLAVVIALELGVSKTEIAERLADWKPSAQRGEVRLAGEQVYYVDCYNANPASMIDAIRFFAERFTAYPKLYVLGSMRELGEYEAAAHREVGACLHLEASDRAAFIGEGREALCAGAQQGGNDAERLLAFATTAEAAPLVRAFRGAILLKGSRAYALEFLLPDVDASAEGEGIAC